MAEKFALEQIRRNRRAIDRHERLASAVAVLPEGAGDQLLAGAGLSRIMTETGRSATRPISL